MLLVAGEQMRGPSLEGSLKNRLIFLGKPDAGRQGSNCRNQADLFQESCQPVALILFGQVERGLLGSVIRGQQFHFFQLPQAGQAGGGAVRGREEHVRV